MSAEPGALFADKFKMERFLHPGQNCMMSVYAPIAFGPLPVLVLKRGEAGQPCKLVAVGSLRSSDPDRICLKKIIISGFPAKVHKKKAMVKYMFFNPDDVRCVLSRYFTFHTNYNARERTAPRPSVEYVFLHCAASSREL